MILLLLTGAMKRFDTANVSLKMFCNGCLFKKYKPMDELTSDSRY